MTDRVWRPRSRRRVARHLADRLRKDDGTFASPRRYPAAIGLGEPGIADAAVARRPGLVPRLEWVGEDDLERGLPSGGFDTDDLP